MQIWQWGPRSIVTVIDVNSSIQEKKNKTNPQLLWVWTWHHPSADLYIYEGSTESRQVCVFYTRDIMPQLQQQQFFVHRFCNTRRHLPQNHFKCRYFSGDLYLCVQWGWLPILEVALVSKSTTELSGWPWCQQKGRARSACKCSAGLGVGTWLSENWGARGLKKKSQLRQKKEVVRKLAEIRSNFHPANSFFLLTWLILKDE